MSIREAYDQWSETYDTNANKTRDLDSIASQTVLSNYAFETVLEIGCGTGKNTKWLLAQGAKVIAMDFSTGMLAKAKSKIQSEKVEFKQADLNQNWDIVDSTMDLVVCNLVLEHIENISFIFEQAHAKLKTEGLFFICELHPFKQYNGSLARFENEKGETQQLEVYWHHLSDFTNNASENGFRLLELKEWFDDHNRKNIPRLLSLVFQKK